MAKEVSSQSRVSVTNNHGETLVGVLHESGSKGLVVLCHGFRSSKEEKVILNLVAAISRERISTFRFDFSGNGESEGSFQYGNYRKEAEDLRAVIKYFLGEGRQIIAIAGHSKGGNAVLLYASMYHDIKKVINISGRFALEKGMEGRLGRNFMERVKEAGFIDLKDKSGTYRVTMESLLDRLSTDMHQASLSIDKDCRVLTIHGAMDEIVPVEDAMDFAKFIPNHALQIIEGADHVYSNHQEELASLVLSFIKDDQVKQSPREDPFPGSKL
ncbi:putative uncharacterized protein YDL057W isoform X1 [Wolffia australiana]